MNPSALDRTAAWLLNLNVQYLDHEGMEPESLRNREDLTQVEKVTCLLIQPLTLTNPSFHKPPRPDTLTQLSFFSLPLISSHISLLETPLLHIMTIYVFPLCPCLSSKSEVPKTHCTKTATQSHAHL